MEESFTFLDHRPGWRGAGPDEWLARGLLAQGRRLDLLRVALHRRLQRRPSGDSPIRVRDMLQTATRQQVSCCGPFLPRSMWKADATSAECHVCCASWTWAIRRHHCRRCGMVACKDCVPWTECCSTRICYACLLDPKRMERLLEGGVALYGTVQPIPATPQPRFGQWGGLADDPSDAVAVTQNVTVQVSPGTLAKTWRSAAMKIISALRATREQSLLEVSLFQATLRQMHCLPETIECGCFQCDDKDNSLGRQLSVAGGDVGSGAGDIGHSSDSQFVLHDGQGLSPARLREIITTLRHDRKSDSVSSAEAFSILAMAHGELARLPNVVHVQVPPNGRLIVVGDIHGQMDDLDYVLQAHGGPSSDTVFLFNGDFVDRGANSVEVLITLLCYMLLDSNAVRLNRGNHEDHNCTARYGFMQESMQKYGPKFYRAASKVFLQLPLMYIVNDKVAVVHAGLPPFPGVTLDEINSINRKVAPKISQRAEQHTALPRAEQLYQALLWSDPCDFDDGTDSQQSYRGVGCLYGEGLTRDFLQGNHLRMLVRSHQVCSAGYDHHHSGRVTTVFSASNYSGNDDNQGCYLVIHPSLEVAYVQHSIISGAGPMELHDIAQSRTATREGAVSAKDECLKFLRQAIFVHRQELLHEFQELDVAHTGTVSVGQWAQACQSCVHREVRWYMLRHYLVSEEPVGKVAYLPFLERFENGMTRSWMHKWATKLKAFIVHRLLEESKKHRNHLTYHELCEVLRREVPGLNERSIYYIVVSLFPGGHVCSRSLDKMARETSSEPPCVLDVWVMSVFRKDAWREFLKEWAEECHVHTQQHKLLHPADVERTLSPNLRTISHQRFVDLGMRHCRQVGGIARKRWEKTSRLLDADEHGIDFQHMVARVRDLGEEWSRASQVLDLLTNITRACCGIQDFFSMMDDNGDGVVTQAESSNSAQKLVAHWLTNAEMKPMFTAFDLDNAGLLSHQNIIDGLAVVDVWNGPLQHGNSHQQC